MMACTARFKMAVLFVVLVVCGLTSLTEASVVRVRRQDCQDGTYEYAGRNCCRCAAGSSVEAHCTGQAQTGCSPCEEGKEYQSHANSETSCEPCTSCEQPNANVEVDARCTPVSDATCKCKDGHYSPTQPPTICDPCKVCGSEGIKVACSATNNTICLDEPQDNTVSIVVGTVIAVGLVGLIAGVALYIWKKKRTGSHDTQTGNEETPEESVPLQPKLEHLGTHIPAVAEVIGWKNMRNLAIKSGIHSGKIDDCELNHKNDSTERTHALLKIWVEKESKDASQKLVQFLRDSQLNTKAEEVLKILSGENSPM